MQGLAGTDLEDLSEDIKVYMELEQGKNVEFWKVLIAVDNYAKRNMTFLSDDTCWQWPERVCTMGMAGEIGLLVYCTVTIIQAKMIWDTLSDCHALTIINFSNGKTSPPQSNVVSSIESTCWIVGKHCILVRGEGVNISGILRKRQSVP